MDMVYSALLAQGYYKTFDQETIEECKWLGYLVIDNTIFNIMVERYEEKEYTIATELLDMPISKSYNEYNH